jgi:transcription antitermination factor NusG
LILAALHPDLVPIANEMPFPIMTTDGLGKRAMNAAAFKLLRTSEGRDITVFAQPFDRWLGQRPRALIAIPGMDAFPEVESVREAAPGDKVLLSLEPFAGMTGVIDQIFRERKPLSNGVRAQVARVTLENGERLIVPLVNLELLP